MNDKERVDQAFEYPLFQALAHRRVRRVGFGYKIDDGVFQYTSNCEPLPLSPLETALLTWAAEGPNGLVMAEQQLSTNVHSAWNGRTHPCPCNMQNDVLSFVNDEGVFFYKMPNATKLVEIEDQTDRQRIHDLVWDHVVKTAEGRPEFPKQAWLTSNLWGVNMPGTTFFVPVLDMTGEYINFCLFAFEHEGYYVQDALKNKPAGVQKWIDNGYFTEGFALPLLMFEAFVYNVVIGMGHYKIQNIALACEALGLGNWTYSGFTPMIILGGTPLCRGLGATFTTGKDGMPNPVAVEGVISAFCPPNYANMDEAVDAVLELRWGKDGIFSENPAQKPPFKDWKEIQPRIPHPKKEAIQITKDFCNYVFNEYGRFPAFFDALQAPVGATVHHLDLGFYEKYYPAGAVHERHRDHLQVWHS